MRSIVLRRTVQTPGDTALVNITQDVHEAVAESGIANGIALVMTLHTTTAITVNEGLEDLEDDILEMIQRLVPATAPYRHARFLDSDGQMAVNAPSHLRGALLGMEVLFPVENGKLVIGGRQTVYLVELDGPLLRNWIVHVMGD